MEYVLTVCSAFFSPHVLLYWLQLWHFPSLNRIELRGGLFKCPSPNTTVLRLTAGLFQVCCPVHHPGCLQQLFSLQLWLLGTANLLQSAGLWPFMLMAVCCVWTLSCVSWTARPSHLTWCTMLWAVPAKQVWCEAKLVSCRRRMTSYLIWWRMTAGQGALVPSRQLCLPQPAFQVRQHPLQTCHVVCTWGQSRVAMPQLVRSGVVPRPACCYLPHVQEAQLCLPR